MPYINLFFTYLYLQQATFFILRRRHKTAHNIVVRRVFLQRNCVAV